MTTGTRQPAAQSDERVREVGRISRILSRPELGAALGAVFVYVFFAVIAYDNNFVSWGSLSSILNAAAPLGILSIAVALLMIAGEFDLSIGSIVGFSGMTIMVLVTSPTQGGFGWSLWPAIAVSLVFALAIGWFNGILVITTRLPSFIVTLGTLFIFRGLTIALTRMITNRTQLGGLADVPGYELGRRIFASSVTIGGGRFSVAILWWLALVAVAAWILRKMTWGNWIFGVGGDANAARNVGVPVDRTRIALFMSVAFAAWLVAVIQAIQFTGADTLRGTGQEFQAIIAAVVGGVLLTGGYGSAIGAALGAFIFAMVKQGIRITGIDGDWFQVFVGAVLVIAVIFNNYIMQKAVKK